MAKSSSKKIISDQRAKVKGVGLLKSGTSDKNKAQLNWASNN